MVTAERRIIYDDPTAGMDLVSTRDANLEKPRYLFTAGQFIDPDRVAQTEHIQKWGGGEELQSHCMRRSVGGLLPRGQMVPLEIWAEAMPPELIGEGLEHDTVTIRGATGVQQAGGGITNRPGFFIGKSLRHVRYYPGDEIKSILRANEGKGIVEIKALFDVPWWKDEANRVPGVPQLLNMDFFPTPPPIELRRLEEMVEARSDRSDLHREVARDMRKSCEQFRRWAEVRLSVEHAMLRERKSHQHVYTYSPVARELLRQLEMPAQDKLFESMGGGISAEQLREIIQSTTGGAQIQPEFFGQLVGEVTRQVIAAQAAAQQAVVDPNPQQEAANPQEPVEPPAEAPKNRGGRPRKEQPSAVAWDNKEDASS